MSILFKEQWHRPDGSLLAIPHVTTKNDTFLRHCQVLKRMGIENYAFPLTLYNPELKNVDVHDLEEDTPENERLRTAVMIESKHNVWYYLRECVRIYSQGGKPVQFRLDRGSCAMVWSFLNGIDYAGMQPRQAQPLSAKIRTPEGVVTMADMHVGKKILAPDGRETFVIGVYPQGVKMVYRITLEGGFSTTCCLDHLWNVYNDDPNESFRTMSLGDIIASEETLSIPVWNHNDVQTLHRIVNIEHIGQEEVQCIEVDHPDHLYITDEDIVSHNTGKTVCALALTSWVIYSSGEDYQIGHFSKDNALRQENVKRVKSFGEFLPKWWLSVNKFKDKNNSEEIYYDALRTHYITMVAQSDKRQADLKARGSSPPMLHIDELEFCVNIDISYPTMLASTGTARENARKNGKPYSNILTTTAGDPSKAECKAAASILSGAMPFSEFLYDLKNKEELHSVVKANSPQMMLLGVFSHLQLGYDNNWLRDMITRNNMTREQTMRDYLNRRVSIQETPVIPKETLALITASEMEHKHIEILNGKYVIYWYIDKEVVQSSTFRHRPIVVGCDSSEMIGRDSTTLVGVDPRDLSVVFTFRANEGNLNVVGAVIAELLLAYPGMIFVPENKSTGVGFIDTVSLILQKHNHNPFKRMFNWIVNNYSDEEFAKYDIRDMSLLDTTAKKYFGIKTDKNKRDQLYSTTLITAAQRAPSRIRDKTLIAELSGLVVKNGRVDHETGSNDDMVVAWLLCMWFILNAKNLDMYGIKPGTIFSLAPSSKDRDEQIELLRQEKIQSRIDELMTVRRRQADPSLRMLIDKDLDLLRTLQEKHGIPDTVVADDLHRNPKKYIDQDIANASKEKSDTDTVKNSIQAIFRSSR